MNKLNKKLYILSISIYLDKIDMINEIIIQD